MNTATVPSSTSLLSDADVWKPARGSGRAAFETSGFHEKGLDVSLPTSGGQLVVHIPTPGTEPAWLWRVLERIAHLGTLSDDWDSYGGRPVELKTLVAGLLLLAEILPADAADPAVVPSSAGGVQFEWHVAGIDLEIELEPEAEIEFAFTDRVTGEERDTDNVQTDQVVDFLRTVAGRLVRPGIAPEV